LIATLKTEGLLSSKRGYYPTPKLIEAYKVTEGFTRLEDLNTLNGVNGVRDEPLHLSSTGNDLEQSATGGRGSNPEGVKPVKPVKTQPIQPSPSRICGDCSRFHTESCQHPSLAIGGDPPLMKADSAWACECKGWINQNEVLSFEPKANERGGDKFA